MTQIPKSHPRAKSLLLRQKLVDGFDKNLVAKEGLLAHGRGEAFDYLLGEKTTRTARHAIRTAAAMILLARMPIISVNGNVAALCPKQVVKLSNVAKAGIEVNLFYADDKRKKAIAKILRRSGAGQVLGMYSSSTVKLSRIGSARRLVDKNGIYLGDVIIVPLEDGDRTLALRKAGKRVITFDLNPLSRTSQTADITIVDNLARGIDLLISEIKKLSKRDSKLLEKMVRDFDNRDNLKQNITEIRENLTRMKRIA